MTIQLHHRLRASRVNGDTSFLWESETFWLFPAHPWRSDPQPILTQNGSNDVHSRKDVPFGVKNRNFSYPLIFSTAVILAGQPAVTQSADWWAGAGRWHASRQPWPLCGSLALTPSWSSGPTESSTSHSFRLLYRVFQKKIAHILRTTIWQPRVTRHRVMPFSAKCWKRKCLPDKGQSVSEYGN